MQVHEIWEEEKGRELPLLHIPYLTPLLITEFILSAMSNLTKAPCAAPLICGFPLTGRCLYPGDHHADCQRFLAPGTTELSSQGRVCKQTLRPVLTALLCVSGKHRLQLLPISHLSRLVQRENVSWICRENHTYLQWIPQGPPVGY